METRFKNHFYSFTDNANNTTITMPAFTNITKQINGLEEALTLHEKKNEYSRQLMKLLQTSKYNDIVQMHLLFKLCNVNYICPISGETLLFDAIRNNYIDIVQALIICNDNVVASYAGNININHINKDGDNALTIACGSSNKSNLYNKNTIIKLLIDNNIDIFIINNCGFNALYYCVNSNNIEIIQILLNRAEALHNIDIINHLYDCAINIEVRNMITSFKNNLTM